MCIKETPNDKPQEPQGGPLELTEDFISNVRKLAQDYGFGELIQGEDEK